jgi:hypothetical protein
MKAARALGVAGAALLAGGCSAGAWRDRAHDLAQIFEVTGSVGPGIGVSVRATELLQVGAGDFDGSTLGLVDGRVASMHEHRGEVGISLLHVYDYERRDSRELLPIRQADYADPGYDPYPFSWQTQNDRHLTDVGVGLNLAIVGFGVTFRIDELFDFLAGCVGFDPLQDDAHGRPLDEVRRQAASLDANRRDRAFDALKRRGEATHGYAIWSARSARPDFQRRAMDEVARDLANSETREKREK